MFYLVSGESGVCFHDAGNHSESSGTFTELSQCYRNKTFLNAWSYLFLIFGLEK